MTCFQSLNYLKNASQQKLPLTMNPRVLYRGYPSNLVNMTSATVWQFVVMGSVQQLLLNGENRSLTDTENLISGMAAGMSSGLLCGPAELVMIQQQRKGGSIQAAAGHIGVSRMFRGLGCCAVREGLWSVGYLSLPTIVRTKLVPYVESEEQRRVMAALSGAFASCVASHPFDTVKTCLQGDIEKAKYKNTASGFSQIFAESGVSGFYRGLGWRYSRQFLAIFLLDKLRTDLTPIIFPPQ